MASTAGQMQTGFGVTAWDGVVPVYETGEKVYIRSQYDTAGQTTFKQNPYTILDNSVSKTDGAGVILDANGIAAVGNPAVMTISTVGAANDTDSVWPTFYRVQQDSNISNVFLVHESLIMSLAGVNIIRDANDWT